MYSAAGIPLPWSSGLFDCFTDCRTCCLTFWCPCITFGRVSEILDKGTSSCCVNGAIYWLLSSITGCGCLYSCMYRRIMREHYSLEKTPCNDCLVHCCCEYCSLCQEYRELKIRGFDLSAGWRGNVERQNRGGVEMAPPPVQGGMDRRF